MKPPTKVIGAQGNTIGLVCPIIPLDPNQMLRWQEWALARIAKAAKLCHEKYGVTFFGLGAYTKIIGPQGGGVEVARRLKGFARVTNGNSATAWAAVEGLLDLAARKGWDPNRETIAVVGVGSTGAVTAHMLARVAGTLLLVGRSDGRLNDALIRIKNDPRCKGKIEIVPLEEAMRRSRLIIMATSSTEELSIDPDWLEAGAIISDVSRPRTIGAAVRKARPDVLVTDGAVMLLPQGSEPVPWCKDGIPACLAEALALALEGRTDECFSLGRSLSLERVEEIGELLAKHGFKLSLPRQDDQPIPRGTLAAHGLFYEEGAACPA